eukprot:COSAG01_NODE_321_length_18903_cov_13.082429_19_plen_79_part_00
MASHRVEGNVAAPDGQGGIGCACRRPELCHRGRHAGRFWAIKPRIGGEDVERHHHALVAVHDHVTRGQHERQHQQARW